MADDFKSGDTVVMFRKLWKNLEFDRREDPMNRLFVIDRVFSASQCLDGKMKYFGRFLHTPHSLEESGIITPDMIAKGETRKLDLTN